MNCADFILLLYPDDYTYRTSGMIFDAIAYEKPVITDNYFLYETCLKEKELGIYVDSAIEIVSAISLIDRNFYNRLVENIRSFKRSYSAEEIGADFAIKIQQIAES